MTEIVIKNPVLGGIADTKYLGGADSVARAVGLDLHGEPGVIKNNQRTVLESGVLIDGFVKVIVNCSNGEAYYFSNDSGKIWRRNASGVFSLAYTTSPAAGSAACTGAREYNGKIYWATESRLHRISTTDALTATWAPGAGLNYATFTKTDPLFHPMTENNLVLYIGDASLLAQVDNDTFSADALDLPTPVGLEKRVSALGRFYTDVLLGTFISSNVSACQIYRWNTWSESFSIEDSVPEIGITAYLAGDNLTMVAAGKKGFIYNYDGSQLSQARRLPGDWSKDNAATINPEAVENQSGTALFGVSNLSGNPCDQGVYSLGRFSPSFPTVLTLEYPISTGRLDGVEIGALALYASTLLVAWRQSVTVTMTIASPGVVSYAAHGLADGAPVKFSTTGALPTGVTAGTIYYAKAIDAGTFHLYDTSANAIAGGSTGRVITSGSQSGVHTAITWGADKVDNTAKQGAIISDGETIDGPFLEARVIDLDRDTIKNFTVLVPYRLLPASTSIKVYFKANNGSWTLATTEVDVDNFIVQTTVVVENANTVEFRVVSVSYQDTCPSFEGMIIRY